MDIDLDFASWAAESGICPAPPTEQRGGSSSSTAHCGAASATPAEAAEILPPTASGFSLRRPFRETAAFVPEREDETDEFASRLEFVDEREELVERLVQIGEENRRRNAELAAEAEREKNAVFGSRKDFFGSTSLWYCGTSGSVSAAIVSAD